MDLTSPAVPLSLLAGQPAGPTTTQAAAASTASASETATRARIDKTARDYESAFLSIMLGQMFSGVKTTTFGGGEGEEAFKSFMTDAMAKSMVRHGGVGLSKTLAREMLKLQGLAANPAAASATAPSPAPPSASAKPVLDIAA